MNDRRSLWCEVVFDDGVCGNPPTSGLEICGSRLRTLLEEPDPRRRRTLAGHPGLAAGVVRQLAEDPDDQVRAQVAAREDLDAATTSRLADPDRESAANVLGSMAATGGGAVHAWELLGTDDPTTLSILAANRRVDPDILEHLARHPDPDVSWTASATLAGQPPAEVSRTRVAEARVFEGLPISEPEPRLSRPTGPAGIAPTVATPAAAGASDATAGDPLPARPPADDPAATRRRRTALAVGAGVLALAAVVLVVVVVLSEGDADAPATAIGPGPATVTTSTLAATTTASSSTSTSTTTTTTVAPTTTVPPTTAAPPTQPPRTEPPAAAPPPAGPISQNFTIRPGAGRFCDSVAVTVNYSPAPGYVTVADDTGARIGAWSGPSGQTETLTLPRPTTSLLVTVTVTGSSLSVSGSASGGSC